MYYDFERLYAIFDSEFIGKKTGEEADTKELSQADKSMDNAISKDSMKLFLHLMLCPDEEDPLSEVYALQKDDLFLDTSILDQSMMSVRLGNSPSK